MKFSKVALAFALAAITFTSCKQEKKTAENTTAEVAEAAVSKKEIPAENLETASFEIQGMTCAMGCAATIEKKLAETEGVKEAKVDFDTKTATVAFDKTVNNQESLTKLVEAVADGKSYKVANFKKV
jgi:copper chaperone CopZ